MVEKLQMLLLQAHYAVSETPILEPDHSEARAALLTLPFHNPVGVVNMFSSGIGGGGFLVIRPSSSSNISTPISIDFRETSPSGSHANMYVGSAAASRVGGLAVGVPGELRGFEAAYKAHGGGVSWERIFQPAIKLAEEGWIVPDELDRRLRLFGQFILEDKEWSKIFAVKDKDATGGKRLKRKGEWISRPAYGRTLRALAAEGADAFYKVR